jgi:transcriptional regulator with PAS, ATPase and Fis domain
MRRLFDTIEKVAEENSGTVLIQGETGSGKELVARAVHALGPRKENNFVPINCGAIPDDLLESELFGYVKGAFTGANNNKIGRIQHAEGGTLFLDEIGEMKPALQVKLLRVLQERKFEPLGGVKSVSFNVRVIAATHRDLEKAVAEGKFREDLYYRLSVLPLHIPPLRERKEDIPLLLEKFIQVFNRERKNVFLGFVPRALTALHDYPWPGNVRELENLVQRMAILHGGSTATLQDLPEKYVTQRSYPPPLESAHAEPAEPCQLPGIYHLKKGLNVDFNSLIEGYEKHLILESLKVTGGNKKEAALLLSLKRTTLLEKIKKNCSILQSSKALHN